MTLALHEPTRELMKGDARLRLQEQPFQILQLLIARQGDVVTRDELRERLWPGGTFVDFEHSLNAAVKRLRAALGDDPKAPRYIETLPRRGYRWIGATRSLLLLVAEDGVAPELQLRERRGPQ
jgi:DNA-binding winged helix-turn-helix (wHTH) protein